MGIAAEALIENNFAYKCVVLSKLRSCCMFMLQQMFFLKKKSWIDAYKNDGKGERNSNYAIAYVGGAPSFYCHLFLEN